MMQPQKSKRTRLIFLTALASGFFCLLSGILVGSYYWFWMRPKISLANEMREWVPENSTPGAYLIINETGRNTVQGGTKIFYEVTAYNLPPHTDFALHAYNKLTLKETAVWSLRSDSTGRLRLDRFTISNFVKGEALLFALISNTSEVRVYEELFPFPIEATGDGGCHVWVELGNTKATSFAVDGKGFEPGEVLDHISVVGDMHGRNSIQTDENGKFTLLMLPETLGKQSGRVEETFIGEMCTVFVEYEWGVSALEVK